MREFEKDELKLFQNNILEIFKWFHNFCIENNLKYYVVGGTCLGAVRHKGFIPWDDDIDVAMPREDYKKFLSLCTNKQDERYIVEYAADNNPEFCYDYAKVYDSRTTLVEHLRYYLRRGLFVDVFPLDGIGNSSEEVRKNYRKISRWINFHMMVTCAVRKNRPWYKNAAVLLGRCISPLFISERKINKKIAGLCEKREYSRFGYIGNLVGNWGIKEIVPKEYFGEPVLYDFEDMKVYGPREAHLYLTALYGDYMKLPPKEKQISHHDYDYISLDESYLKKD